MPEKAVAVASKAAKLRKTTVVCSLPAAAWLDQDVTQPKPLMMAKWLDQDVTQPNALMMWLEQDVKQPKPLTLRMTLLQVK